MSILVFLLLGYAGASDPLFEEMVRIRRHLHQHPELSNREDGTRDYLRAQLQAAGFTRIETMANTGLRVVYDTGKPGPVVAFRADIDALPVDEQTGLPFASRNQGVMHACGHDLHAAILFGAALSIRQNPDLTGVFVFLFQPAEEGPPPGEEGGASLMIADGALNDPTPEVIFGLHVLGSMPVGVVGTKPQGIMARADRFLITINGKQAHGSAPQNGVDPIYLGAELVSQAQSIVSRKVDARDPVVVSFGSFQAGNRFNIIPASAELRGTIRTFNPETGDRVPQVLDAILNGLTRAHDATYEFQNETLCPSTQNDPDWTRKAVAMLGAGGIEVQSVEPAMFAEDFAFYAQQVPGVYFFLGAGGDGRSDIHKPDFKPDEEAMKRGLAMWLTLAEQISRGATP